MAETDAAQDGTPQPEAGWHPDPDGSGAWRWWDGQRWGELAPAEGAADPGGEVLYRAEVRSTRGAHLKAKELLVTNDWITVDGDGVEIDALEHVAFWRTWAIAQTFEYRRGHFELAGGGRQIGFFLSGRRDATDAVAQVDELFLAMAQMLDARVLTRIGQDMARQLAGGQTVDLKSAKLDGDGVTSRGAGIRKKSLRWGDITYAAWGGEWVNLRGQEDDSGQAPVVQVDAKNVNAVAIPALVDVMQGR